MSFILPCRPALTQHAPRVAERSSILRWWEPPTPRSCRRPCRCVAHRPGWPVRPAPPRARPRHGRRARISALFSPMPPVKTRRPGPPAQRRANQFAPDAVDVEDPPQPGTRPRRSPAACMSLDTPDTPSSPDWFVDQLFDGARIHAALVHQVQRLDAGSMAPQRVPIGKAIDRREAHRAGDTAAGGQGAQCWPRCPGAGPPCALGSRRIELRQHRRDVFVGQAVEAVAAHPGIVQLLGPARTSAPAPAARGGTPCRSRPLAEAPVGARAAAGLRRLSLWGWLRAARAERTGQVVQHR